MSKKITTTLENIEIVVAKLKEILPSHCILFLNGDLGSGKTTLVQAIASSCGIKSDVTSPTFSLQHVYSNSFFHYDLYRIDIQSVLEMGLFEEFDKQGWHFVEWGEDSLRDFLESAGYNTCTIEIHYNGKEMRDYIIGDTCTP